VLKRPVVTIMSIDELDVIEAIEVTIPEAWAEARAKEGSGQRIHPHLVLLK
jgi:hypothetical protein